MKNRFRCDPGIIGRTFAVPSDGETSILWSLRRGVGEETECCESVDRDTAEDVDTEEDVMTARGEGAEASPQFSTFIPPTMSSSSITPCTMMPSSG